MRNAAIVLWMLVTFCLSVGTFTVVFSHFLTMSELWHQRVADSNISYALALFFVLFIALGHGLSAAYIKNSSFISKIYRIALLPVGLGVALISFFPVAFAPTSALDVSSIVVVVLWILISGAAGTYVGHWIASGSWFREKILVGTGSHRGMGGAFGFWMYNAGLLLILFSGILIK